MTLMLSSNPIGDRGASCVASCLLAAQPPTTLLLSKCEIACAGAASLSDALRVDASLTQLDLQNNHISDKGASALADSLMVNQSLLQLTLGKLIGNVGATQLGKMLKVRATLASFLPSQAALVIQNVSICSWQANSTLTVLNLGGNQIGDDGGCALASALRSNRTLQQLLLTNNRLGPMSASAFGESLAANHTSVLHTLALANNQLGAIGAQHLCDALAPAPVHVCYCACLDGPCSTQKLVIDHCLTDRRDAHSRPWSCARMSSVTRVHWHAQRCSKKTVAWSRCDSFFCFSSLSSRAHSLRSHHADSSTLG